MIRFRRSIYWKLLFTFLASLSLASLAIGIMFLVIDRRIDYPQLDKIIIRENQKMANRINLRLQNASTPLKSIIKEIHEKDNINIRVFDIQGNELAAFMEERLKSTKIISLSIIEETLRLGVKVNTQSFNPSWWTFGRIFVVSVPLTRAGKPVGILQNYYTPSEGLTLLPLFGFQIYIPIIIIVGFTALLSRLLTRPIRELTEAAEKMSKGNFGVRVKIRSRDEIGQLGKTFNEMSERLAGFQKSRRELLADISHEIRSPLARLQSDAEILIDREMEKEEKEQHLQTICEEVKNISLLVEDLSILSRLEHNQLELSISPSSIQDVLLQEISKFRLRLEKKGINLHQNIPENLPLVMLDTKRVGQVVSNLLMNSLRYTPKGGTIEIGLKRKGSMAEVWVQDTGPGIPQEELPYIFDRFYRVDKSRSRKSGGTGLGLAIAKHFVEAQGGQIHAESEPGQGTSIIFTLPIV